MGVRTRLDDRQWAKIEAILASRGKRGRPPNDDRNFVEAVLWIHRTGAPWRDLPSEFGSWKTVYSRFNEWSKRDVWTKVFNALPVVSKIRKRCEKNLGNH